MKLLNSHFDEHIEVSINTRDFVARDLAAACKILETTLRNGCKILVAGNGGSASDASHFCAELVCAYENRNRVGIPAVCLCSDSALITAISNDMSYEKVFSRQISALYQRGDAVILISTSGSSKNILDALNYCFTHNIPIVLLTSIRYKATFMPNPTSVCVSVPSTRTSLIQEMHITILHIIADFLEHLVPHR